MGASQSHTFPCSQAVGSPSVQWGNWTRWFLRFLLPFVRSEKLACIIELTLKYKKTLLFLPFMGVFAVYKEHSSTEVIFMWHNIGQHGMFVGRDAAQQGILFHGLPRADLGASTMNILFIVSHTTFLGRSFLNYIPFLSVLPTKEGVFRS